jgi:large subunit ribosomal protein L13
MYVQKSYVLKPSEANKKWYLIDAEDQVVGRLATKIADILRGKNSAQFTPNADSGDFVVVINADKVKFTGNKWDNKNYYWHTNHIGGLKKRTAKEQLEKHPELIIMNAVKGMLPKTSLGRKQLTKLKVFVGSEHTHSAQNPVELKL